MNSSVTQKIPAGLLDESFELFSNGDQQYCVAEGRLWTFPDFPLWVLRAVKLDMLKNQSKVDWLIKAGLFDELNQMKWYIHCCFGGFDGEADFVNGELVHTEYFDCGHRGHCLFEGKVCNSIVHQFGLSAREVDYIKCVHQGMQDKEIAEEMGISVNTAPVYIRNILKKLQLGNRSDIVRFASDHKIINQINY